MSDPKLPFIGAAVLLSIYDGQHKVNNTIAHVIGVSLELEEDGHPSVTVVFPKQPVDVRTLTGVKWYDGFQRAGGVVHQSHKDNVDGKVSIVYGDVADIAEMPALLEPPAGDATRSNYQRQQEPEALTPSIGAAVAVQSGKAPLPTTQSPAINEPPVEPPTHEKPVDEDEMKGQGVPKKPIPE